jgi:enoyl-CoA hydratase
MTSFAPPDPRVTLARGGHVAAVTIDRPEKLNAIDPAMLEALRQTFLALDSDDEVRAVILTGGGERAFSVGADIEAWAALQPLDMWRRWVRDGHRAIDTIASARQPVIAAIGGLALGGGLELALACDIRIAADSARLGSPEVRIGTVPGWGGTRRLVEAVGQSRARHLILTGNQIEAATAERWGLVSEVVPREKVVGRAREIAETIAANAPVAVQLAKAVLAGGGDHATMEAIAGALAATSEDAAEGLAAFRQKRPGRFRGR